MAAEDWYPGVGNDPIDTSGKYIDSSGAVQYGGGPAGSGVDVSELIKMAIANRGRNKLAGIYSQNLKYQKMIQDEAYARSLPKDVHGPAGMVTFDDETEEMMMEFSPEMQDLYDGWLRAEQRAGEELGAYDMDERTIKQIGMFDAASAERDRQAKLAMDEQIFAQGIGGTQGYYNQMALSEQVNQRRLQEALRSREMAMGERNLLSAEQLAFGNAAIDSPRMLMQQADLSRAIGQGSHTGVNVPGVSLGSLALADTKAGFWSGLLGGASKYGGGASTTGGSGGTTPTGAAGSTNPYGSSIMSSLIPGLLGGFF